LLGSNSAAEFTESLGRGDAHAVSFVRAQSFAEGRGSFVIVLELAKRHGSIRAIGQFGSVL